MTGAYCHAGPDKPAPYLIRGHPEDWQDLYTTIIYLVGGSPQATPSQQNGTYRPGIPLLDQ